MAMETASETVQRSERELERAFGNLGKIGSAGPIGKRRAAEAVYSDAYQRLVRLGARPQIRRKYRTV